MKKGIWGWEDAITKSNLEPMTRLVLLTLRTYMNAKNEQCFPGAKKIAQSSGMCLRSVFTHLDKAEKAGFVVITKKKNHKGGHDSNEYTASYPHAGDALPLMQEVHDPHAGDAPPLVQEMHTNIQVEQTNEHKELFEEVWSEINSKLVKSRRGGKKRAYARFVKLCNEHDPNTLANAIRGYYKDAQQKKNNYAYAASILVCLGTKELYSGYLNAKITKEEGKSIYDRWIEKNKLTT